VEAYVTGVVASDGVGMGSAIVQENGEGLGGGLCYMGLGGCKGAEVAEGEKGGVDGTSVVPGRANDFLESCEARGVQGVELSTSGVS
jgi:hypothetical protein